MAWLTLLLFLPWFVLLGGQRTLSRSRRRLQGGARATAAACASREPPPAREESVKACDGEHPPHSPDATTTDLHRHPSNRTKPGRKTM